MQPKKSARIVSTGVKTLALAVASSFLLYSGADAAGLGKLTVLSALGQPLRAEIELTSVTKDDAGNLVPKLASQEAYRQANIGYNSNLNSLNFAIEERGARRFVVVTSSQSVSEPFLELLVELNSSSGKLIREYTVLLDPVEMQANNAPLSTSSGTTLSSQPNVVSTPIGPVAPAAPSSPVNATQPAAQTPTQTASPSPVSATKSTATGAPGGTETYQIKAGDTLSKIANQYKPQGVSLEQMLVALQRSNSAAFIDNNMNLLRSGRILTIPDVAEIDQTKQSEAKKIVLAQSNDFYTYRNKLAGQVEQAKPEKAVEPKKTDGGKITAKVEEAPTPVNDAKDKLKLSKAQEQKELAEKKALEEDKIAKQRALDAANARVKELEANTAKLQNILDLKNKANAKNAAPAAASAAATTPAPASAAAASSLPSVDAAVTASKPVIKPRPKVEAPPPPPPGLMENLSKYLPYGAGVLLVLGLIGLVASKRKKKTEHFDDESILTGSSIKTNSLFGSTGGQSVDTNNSVFNSNFAPSASQLDANEVDPVAEADVYIAYGRDEQAEEILKEALRTQPDRQAVRVKLLEIYAHRKDTRTFESVASDLYGMTGGEGPDWAQAASLGIIIDPQNPLYAGGQAGHSSPALGASTLPVESLDPEALLGNSLSQEMLDSLSAKTDIGNSMMMGGDINERTHRIDGTDEGLDFDLGLSINPTAEDDFGASPALDLSKADAHASDVPMYDPNNAQSGHNEPVLDLSADAPSLDSNDLDFTSVESSAPIAPRGHAQAGVVESPAAVEPDSDEAGGMDFAALDFDFDIPKSKSEEVDQVGTKQVGTAQVEAKPIEAQNLSHDDTFAEKSSEKPSPALDYDFSNIDLNLPKADDVAGSVPAIDFSNTADLHAPQTVDLDDTVSEAAPDNEFNSEMATKLDLAVAYQEIGDKDGARELLEEVIKGGTSEQIDRAKTLMHELA